MVEEEHRQRLKEKVWEIVETHPTIAAIRNGEALTDLQLVALYQFNMKLHRIGLQE